MPRLRRSSLRGVAYGSAVLVTAACAASPSPLRYGVPVTPSVVYGYTDTTVVGVSLMGATLEIGMQGDADYGVSFASAASGVEVTLTVDRLDGSVSLPMGAGTQTFDGSGIDGPLVFTLDRRGDATLVSAPEVSVEASRMISGLTTVHTFFPGLPDRVVDVGDSWVDSVSYGGDAGPGGEVSEEAIYEYTVVGDTVVDGRPLTKISLAGTSEMSATMAMGDMQVRPRFTVEHIGHVLWDAETDTMFEMVRRGEGTGTASVPLSPQPLPIEVQVTQRTRLLERE